MAGHGVYQIPREFKDEDKWFKYFTKKQALVVLFCGVMDYQMINLFAVKNLLIAGILLSCLLTIILVGGFLGMLMFFTVMVVLPLDNFFLTGGGLTIMEWLLRYLYRRKSRCLYTKNMDDGEMDEKENS